MKFLLFLLSLASFWGFSSTQCLLPTKNEALLALKTVLENIGDGTANSNVVIVSNLTFTCLVTAGFRKYSYASIVARYQVDKGAAQVLGQFQVNCVASVWVSFNSELEKNVNESLLSAETRQDCFQCKSIAPNLDTYHNCRPCPAQCRPTGSGRCVSNRDCCPFYSPAGTCVSNCPSLLHFADSTTNYRCTCPDCNEGYDPNPDTCECEITDICRAEDPCLNGGQCTLLASPFDYNCTCSQYYSGENCTNCSLVCEAGYAPNDNCSECICNNCQCPPGYTGPTCNEVDYCAGANGSCSNNGRCVNQLRGFKCSCNTGYDGDSCSSCATNYAREGTRCEPIEGLKWQYIAVPVVIVLFVLAFCVCIITGCICCYKTNKRNKVQFV